MTILCGWRGVTVPAAGTVVTPLMVTLLEVKVTGVLLVLCTVMVCEPGDCAPCTPAKIRPAGCTMGPTLVPGGRTVKTGYELWTVGCAGGGYFHHAVIYAGGETGGIGLDVHYRNQCHAGVGLPGSRIDAQPRAAGDGAGGNSPRHDAGAGVENVERLNGRNAAALHRVER